MATYKIKGGEKLKGTVRISGNKNAILPCMAACLLTDQKIVLKNTPEIKDVAVLRQILEELGVKTEFKDNVLTLETKEIKTIDLPKDLTDRLRGSVLLAGSLLGRMGKVSFSHPGGDVIGKRAIEQHLEGFKRIGFDYQIKSDGYSLKTSPKQVLNCHIFLELPTVTGTENLILAAVLKSNCYTVIRNAACEPHVVDLCNLLSQMGADIKGIGTNKLEIMGVEKLGGAEFMIGPDPLEFGTYAIAAAITKGELELKNCSNLDLEPIAWPLEKMGVNIEQIDDGFKVSAGKLVSIDTNFPFTANFWPGFPSDLMSVMIVLATQAEGVSILRDFIYESRMFFVDKLIKMGANITIADPHRVFVYGPTPFIGAELESPDIRAGMALVLAALVAKGESKIHKAEHMERGYANPVETLKSLGADIERVTD
jgi:UDP-N-acetylglucosamine 1-carboxyvinyltransferase